MQKMKAKSVAELACLIHAVTNGNGNSSSPNLASLLDVHLAASICEKAGGAEPLDDDPLYDSSHSARSLLRRPR